MAGSDSMALFLAITFLGPAILVLVIAVLLWLNCMIDCALCKLVQKFSERVYQRLFA